MNQARIHTNTKKTRTKNFIHKNKSSTNKHLDLYPMNIPQHTTKRWSTKNNLDIQNHAKTNQQISRRKTRIQQQNNNLKKTTTPAKNS